jgi:hypothetical protein
MGEKLYPEARPAMSGFAGFLSERRLWWICIIGALQALRFVFSPTEPSPRPHLDPLQTIAPSPVSPPSPASPPSTDPAALAALNHAAAHWFGNNATLDWVHSKAPSVADEVEQIVRNQAADGLADTTGHNTDLAMRDALFSALHGTGRNSDSRTLHDVQTLRLRALRAIGKDDPQACINFITADHLAGKVALPASVEQGARKLGHRLAEEGQLGPQQPSPRHQAMIRAR